MAAEATKPTGTDFMNPENEQIRAEFVRRNVLLCQTALVEKCLSNGTFEEDSIINYYTYPELQLHDGLYIQHDYSKRMAKISDLESFAREANNVDIAELYEADIDAINEQETEPQEIYEWWAVDSRFSEGLQAKGEPIINNEFGIWWGRTTTGQAINMDELIHSICFDLEILDGQPRSWAKNA